MGVVQSHHLPVASIMIEAGKHVLCEKPLCMNVKETKQLIQLAKEKKVFLMEVSKRYIPTGQPAGLLERNDYYIGIMNTFLEEKLNASPITSVFFKCYLSSLQSILDVLDSKIKIID